MNSSTVSARVPIYVPEVADHEVRRELGDSALLTPGIHRLDALAIRLPHAEITTLIMRKAAGFWADLRRRGLPTAGGGDIDADAILAAHAALVGGPGDVVTVATGNVAHLARFPGIHAQECATIV